MKYGYQNQKNLISMLKLVTETEEKTVTQIIAETKVATAKADKNIVDVKVPKNTERLIKDCLHNIKIFNSTLPVMERVFTEDQNYKNGFCQKSVINALKEPKYERYLKDYSQKIKKESMLNEDNLLEYYICNRLFTNLVEMRATFKVLKTGLNVLIKNLQKSNVANAKDLTVCLSFLITRLSKLFDIYGYYLKDIGGNEAYEDDKKGYEIILKTLHALVILSHELEERN